MGVLIPNSPIIFYQGWNRIHTVQYALRQSPEAVAHEVYGWFTTFYDRLAGLDGLHSTSDDWLRLRK